MTHVIVQYNPFAALQQGYYDGSMTIDDLKRHGDFAIGAMEAIDGEMVGVDGAMFQIAVDGTLVPTRGDQRLPWAMVTHFQASLKKQQLPPNLTYAALRSVLDALPGASNLYLAFRIDGFATSINARSLPKQQKPYPLLSAVKKTSYDLADVPIVGVGFRSPSYVGDIDPNGCHLHFVTADRQRGGHINDFTLRDGTLRVAFVRKFDLLLPQSAFDGAPAQPSVVGT
jgi:acetolactate decarboxylase